MRCDNPLGGLPAGLQRLELGRAHPAQASQTPLELGGGVWPSRGGEQVHKSRTHQTQRMVNGESRQKAKLRQTAVMLTPVLPGGAVKLQIKSHRRIGRTCPAIVNGARTGEEHHFLACLPEAVRSEE